MTARFAALMVGAAAALGAAGAQAGEFKTLNTQSLPVGGVIHAYSSPKNTSSAMEMEVYEWQTPAGGTYNCGIDLSNGVPPLHVNLIGLTGAPLASCTTVSGTCTTPTISLGGGFKFMCTVSSGAGSAAIGDLAWYRIAVKRVS
jgi:hypothetical protein